MFLVSGCRTLLTVSAFVNGSGHAHFVMGGGVDDSFSDSWYLLGLIKVICGMLCLGHVQMAFQSACAKTPSSPMGCGVHQSWYGVALFGIISVIRLA